MSWAGLPPSDSLRTAKTLLSVHKTKAPYEIVDWSEDLIDCAYFGLVLEEEPAIELGDIQLLYGLAHHLFLAGVQERAHF